MQMDTIRPYQSRDFDACMALFDANVPVFFSAGERADFAGFLSHHAAAWHYQLLERGNAVAGCAGYAIGADGTTASLCWGMVHPRLHRCGVGTQLLLARLEALRQMPDVRRVILDTSQHTRLFYARFGFVVQQVTVDAMRPDWSAGIWRSSCSAGCHVQAAFELCSSDLVHGVWMPGGRADKQPRRTTAISGWSPSTRHRTGLSEHFLLLKQQAYRAASLLTWARASTLADTSRSGSSWRKASACPACKTP
ncbi:hypothetical protein XPR_0111 [Xanthomonas arboricola pv. pruni MAFF 301420]|uniref:N-acetyltransferase domain-containing protein n=2 Tax=Xanthomonas arboricola pv. pruni TaxID=69929 RepID=W4SAF7_9XANT|nr:hypothetical protein XPU_1631 [Xanthomonas arboricola pv. pruni str. MAFF 311562]GAE53476.1 hypothetical protein XPR_0111 [Xanthomonas arboricola pv. pruni MAFF 301420]